ncbi:MAG: SOS response-associated peptidase [Ilumatobacteraceae bacterium]
MGSNPASPTMCGRVVAANSAAELAAVFEASPPDHELPLRYNIAPTSDIYGIVGGAERAIEIFRWGLVPSWVDSPSIGSKMINARAETLAEKRSFAPLLRSRRLLVPMTGFYEWRRSADRGQRPQPFFIHRADGTPLAAAGLWTTWRDGSAGDAAPVLHTCTIITTAANATMSAVHDRMPAVLERDDWQLWLDPEVGDPADVLPLLIPAAEGILEMRAVSADVNSVRNDRPDLINPCP